MSTINPNDPAFHSRFLTAEDLAAVRQELAELENLWQMQLRGDPSPDPTLTLDVLMSAKTAALVNHDLPRCLDEIDRRAAENERIKQEVAKIVMLAQKKEGPDGVTYDVVFTKEMIAQLEKIALAA